jgi:hypothetical protein
VQSDQNRGGRCQAAVRLVQLVDLSCVAGGEHESEASDGEQDQTLPTPEPDGKREQ